MIEHSSLDIRVLIIHVDFRLFDWKEEVPETDHAGKRHPKARSGHKIVYYNGCIYAFGGYNPNVSISDHDLMEDAYWKDTRPLFKEVKVNFYTFFSYPE